MSEIPAPLSNYAVRIVDRLGGAAATARLLGVSRGRVEHWTRAGSIPDRYWQLIIDRAAEAGILVTPFCFVAHLRAAEPEMLKDAA